MADPPTPHDEVPGARTPLTLAERDEIEARVARMTEIATENAYESRYATDCGRLLADLRAAEARAEAERALRKAWETRACEMSSYCQGDARVEAAEAALMAAGGVP